jgi:CheY-like chemotaxis protein
MPEIDGWEVLQNLKKNQKTTHIPVIMISVSPDKDTGFALGAVGYLMKPVRPETLLREVTRLNLIGKPTIMVVDDNLIERSELAHIIRQKDFTILEAENGLQCLHLLKNQLPDLILLDLMMPVMDGFELLDRIRLDPRTRNIPVIIITARDLSSEEKDALQGKVSSLLVKGSFDADRVLLELTTLVRGLGSQPAPHILLVDDNEVVIVQVKSVLEPAGYHIDVAHGGEEALDYIKNNIPDGIVLDLMMPGVDGFMVLDAMRSTPSTEKIPVLILTAKTLTREELSRLKANNVKQLLQKGDVDKEELLSIIRHMFLKLPETPETPETPGSQISPHSRPAILLVEDNPDNLVTVRAILGKDYDITEARDGVAALEILKTTHPDLILLDMGLPGMDGLAVLQRIKQDPAKRYIPVIALTAHAMKDDREKYMGAGCSDYLSKPFTPELLTEKINKWSKG